MKLSIRHRIAEILPRLSLFALVSLLWLPWCGDRCSDRVAANDGLAFGLTLSAALSQGTPLGMPPGPVEDSVLSAIPDEAALVLSFNQLGTASSDSENRTERLLAEPEVVALLEDLSTAVSRGLRLAADDIRPLRGSSVFAAEFAKTLLSQSTTVYLSLDGEPGQCSGGLISKIDDQAGPIKTILDGMATAAGPDLVESQTVAGNEVYSLKGAPLPIVIGIVDDHFVVGVGNGEFQSIRERVLAKKMPEWLTAILKHADIPRRSSLSYVNLTAWKQSAPTSDRFAELIDRSGLNQLLSCSTVTGLDENGTVVSTWLQTDPSLHDSIATCFRPLNPEDLAAIPSDARLGASATVDVTAIARWIYRCVEASPNESTEEFDNEFRRELGFDLRRDLLPTLGDTAVGFESPSEGGGFFSGMTAVMTLKDADKFKALFATFLARAQENERSLEVRTKEFQGQSISYLHYERYGPPLAPAWCITDKQFIVSTFPQGVIAFLGREDGEPGLASTPAVVAELQTQPAGLIAVDEPAIAAFAHPMLLMGMTQIPNEFPEEIWQGIQLDVASLPSLPSVSKHLGTATVAIGFAEGIEIRKHHTLPPIPWLLIPLGEVLEDTLNSYTDVFFERDGRGDDVALDAAPQAIESPAPLMEDVVTFPLNNFRPDDSPLSLAAEAFARGDYRTALLLYQNSGDDGKLDYNAQVGIGRCLFEMNRYSDSEAAFDGAVKMDATRVEGFLGRGKAKWIQDRNEDSLPDLRRATEIDDQSAESWLYLALAHQSLGQHDVALQHFDTAIDLQEDRWFARYQRGRTHLALENHQAAIYDFNRAIEISPDNTNAHLQRARAYRSMGRYLDSIADLNTRLAALPLEQETIRLRAKLFRENNELLKAARDYSAIIGMNPRDIDALRERGGCFLELELFEDAIADYQAATKIEPDAWTYANLATCYEYLDDYEKVDQYYTQSLELEPEYAVALTWRAFARQELKKYPEAKADYQAAIKAGADDDPVALGNYSWLLSGCPDESVRDGQLALQLAQKADALYDGKEAWVVDNIAAAYAELGDFENAITWVKKAIELADNEADREDIRSRLLLYQNNQPARF